MNYLHNVKIFPQGAEKLDSPPGAPQERSSLLDSHAYIAEVKELQRRYSKDHMLAEFWNGRDVAYRYVLILYLLYIRLDGETQQRIAAEEQLMATQDQLKRYDVWHQIKEMKLC